MDDERTINSDSGWQMESHQARRWVCDLDDDSGNFGVEGMGTFPPVQGIQNPGYDRLSELREIPRSAKGIFTNNFHPQNPIVFFSPLLWLSLWIINHYPQIGLALGIAKQGKTRTETNGSHWGQEQQGFTTKWSRSILVYLLIVIIFIILWHLLRVINGTSWTPSSFSSTI